VWSVVKTDVQVVGATIQKAFYRNGQLREQVPMRNGHRHGVVRVWHKNGKRASEEPFKNGLLHGVCRHWNEAGRLLGKYQMVHGTGIQREWHDNGKLQIEISTVRGEFSGRNRLWLRDGTLLSERYYLRGQVVGADAYHEATTKDKALPKFRGKPAKLPPKSRTTEKHILKVFVLSLLEKPNRSEARKWLSKKTGDKTARSLGRFKREHDAAKFVQALYEAGAVEVIAPDIYRNQARDQFADCLLVQLPGNAAKRKAIRKVCVQLRTRRLGAMQPDGDIGESHLYLSLA
jgi:antitoxin component YwqK of YwqJK toxin-antitoxin module